MTALAIVAVTGFSIAVTVGAFAVLSAWPFGPALVSDGA